MKYVISTLSEKEIRYKPYHSRTHHVHVCQITKPCFQHFFTPVVSELMQLMSGGHILLKNLHGYKWSILTLLILDLFSFQVF